MINHDNVFPLEFETLNVKMFLMKSEKVYYHVDHNTYTIIPFRFK